MDYMGTLRRGWDITWKNKWLWLLGFLAALGGGSSFGSSSNYSSGSSDVSGAAPNVTPEMIAAIVGGAFLVLCIAFIVGILMWLVSLASKGGLITAVAELDRGQETRFGTAFRQGWRKVLPLIGMTLVLYGVVIVLAIILAIGFGGSLIAALSAGANMDSNAMAGLLGTAGVIFLCLLCLLIPLSIVLSFIYPFAFRGMMLRNMGVMESIRHGWAVLRSHLGDILVLGLIFFVIGLLVGLVSGAIIGLLGVSTGLISVLMSGGEPTTAQIVAGIVGFLATAVVFAIISAIVIAWRSATFTLAYEQWTGKDVLKDSAAPLPATPMAS